jgi:hypothetical protein
MQAYKLKGKIDITGKLILDEHIKITPGEVEVIILKSETKIENKSADSEQSLNNRPSKVKAFQSWFAKTEAELLDVDLEDSKWQHFQEKYKL